MCIPVGSASLINPHLDNKGSCECDLRVLNNDPVKTENKSRLQRIMSTNYFISRSDEPRNSSGSSIRT